MKTMRAALYPMLTSIETSPWGLALVTIGTVTLGALNVYAFRLPWIANFSGSADGRDSRLAAASLAIALVQSLVLFLVARRFVRGSGYAAPIAAMIIAIGISGYAAVTLAPQSQDAYAYIGYAKLDSVRAAYAPPNQALPAAFSSINTMWGKPLLPSIYGPLWLAYNHALLEPATSIDDALFRLRVSNLVALGAIIAALALLRVPRVVIWLFAVNPMIWNNFVLSAHNDVIPIALCCAALVAAANAMPLIAVLLVASAGLCKITFAAIGLVVFARLAPLRQRLIYSGLSVLIIAAVSLYGGGLPYAHAFGTVAGAYTRSGHAAGTALHYALAALAVLGTAVALLRQQWIIATPWAFSALGVNYFSWYAAWGLPFSLASERHRTAFMISLPVVSAMIFAPLSLFSAPAIALVCIGLTVYQLRRIPLRERVAVATQPEMATMAQDV